MKTHVRFGKQAVFKRYASRKQAEDAARYGDLLSKAGVLTPQGRLAGRGCLVAYHRIGGVAGLPAIAEFREAILAPMMKQARTLHTATPPGGIAPFDPLKRIVPRLTDDLEAVYAPFVAAALEDIDRASAKPCLVHGDLHAGQYIADAEGNTWLLDFDDLALAPLEADLGNFAAHLATRPETMAADYVPGMRQWLVQTVAAYRASAGEVNVPLAEAYGRIALVRRALKLAARGDHAVEARLRSTLGT